MFENSLIESSVVHRGAPSLWTKGLSFTLELLLLSFAVLMPLFYTEALPRHVFSGMLEAPAPPPAAPAPRTLPVATHSQVRSELNEGHIMLPQAIPQHAQQVHDEAMGNTDSSSEPIGVVGAPPTGASNTTIASLLHALPPPATLKSVTPQSIRLSSGVAQGLLLHQVRPQYPGPARSVHIQGAVVLQATIGKDGSIQNLHLISGHPLLAQAAMDAVRQWRYRPYLLNNQPIDVDTTIQVNFVLSGAN
jgi:periplasmic protein TonB